MSVDGITILGIPVVITATDAIGLLLVAILILLALSVGIATEVFILVFRRINRKKWNRRADDGR